MKQVTGVPPKPVVFSLASRERRGNVFIQHFPSEALFISGLIAMPAFLFNPSIASRCVQFTLFILINWLAGRKLNLIPLLIASAGIIGFNLIVPYGRVLYTLMGWRITEGALWAGIERAVTVEGLILLSRVSIRSDLRLPGALGALIGESFRYFERILERKGGIERKDPIGGIDRLMLELWEGRSVEKKGDQTSTQPRRRPLTLAYALLIPILGVIWAASLLPLVLPGA